MKTRITLLVILMMVSAPTADAKNAAERSRTFPKPGLAPGDVNISRDGALPGREDPRRAEAVDTTVLAEFTFDLNGCDPQGWTALDWTAQTGDYFHVDDFAGLAGGDFGRLVAPQGSQAVWCGARSDPVSETLCSYSTLPGYGNSWNQAFCTRACLAVDTSVVVDYLVTWDSEPWYDFTFVEVDNCDENWLVLQSPQYTDIGSGFESVSIPNNLHAGQLRIRFRFASDGAWSDEDGIWNTDGAFILDSVTVSDASGLVLATETFEDEAPGDLVADDWETCTPPGYGDFSGLFPGTQMVQEDPCVSNLSCVWAFINGSTYDYACGGFPGQKVVPYGNNRDQYIENSVVSPPIPWVGTGDEAELAFDVYLDLSLNSLILETWYVRSLVDGCPGSWMGTNLVGFPGGNGDWQRKVYRFGSFVDPAAEEIQVALGVIDLCPFYCGTFGTGECHSHSPMFDNVSVIRLDTNGPQWYVRDRDLFQDTFAEDGTTTGTARADMAIDIAPGASINTIIPGDSAVVNVSDPSAGLATDPYTGSGPAVYAYLTVWPDGSQSGPDIASGEQSNNGYERYPLVDSLLHDGKWWYCVRFDTLFTNGGLRTGVGIDRFCVDLNDNTFTPGDTVCFFFCAENTVGERTYYAFSIGITGDADEAFDNPMEFTILPAGGWLRGGDVLYVDAFNGFGAQPFFEDSFDRLGLTGLVDRYDVRGSNYYDNGPGSRVTDVETQLAGCYRKIIWNSGRLSDAIGDGTGNPDKSDDATILYEFLEALPETGGLYLSGDNMAASLSQLNGAGAINLRSKYIGYTLKDANHANLGLGVSPLVVGEAGSCFDHTGTPDVLVAYGACPTLNRFDVIQPAGGATLEATYEGNSGGDPDGAIVAQSTINPDSAVVGVVLSGFSFHAIRDDEATSPQDRWDHLRDILLWLGNTPQNPIGAGGTPYRNDLAQNTPNPFNPTTTIRFEVRERSRVQLRIYNIAGQLVRTLVDDERTPGEVHVIEWDGTNTHGEAVSSGVYFYKLTAPDFTKTRKMVLLK